MLLKFAVIFLLAKLLDAEDIVTSCIDGWIQLDDQCYYKGTREMDFYSAERFCRVRLAAHLPILKDNQVARLYYNLLLFHSSPYDTWLGIIPLKQLNNTWKWLDGSDVIHQDMREKFIVDNDWGFDDSDPKILPNHTYKEAITSIAAYYYLENLHCTLLILSEDGGYTPKFDFTRCDQSKHFYCQKQARIISSKQRVSRVVAAKYQTNVFLILTLIALIILVIFLLIFGFFNSNVQVVESEATAFYSSQ